MREIFTLEIEIIKNHACLENIEWTNIEMTRKKNTNKTLYDPISGNKENNALTKK